MAELIDEIAGHVETGLRLGFEGLERVVEGAIDLFGADDGYPGDDCVRELAAETLRKLLEEQASWSRPTDAERLAAAFERLNTAGILARHNYAPTRTWGLGELQEEAKWARARGAESRGYVYYTSQDAEALSDGSLFLAFGAFVSAGTTHAETAQATHAIAGEIYDQLVAQGLDVDWDGGVDSTIRLHELEWNCPRDSEGNCLVRNQRIEALDASAKSEESRETAKSPWPLTKRDEWWVIVTFIAFDGSNAAAVALDVIYDSLNPDTQATVHRGPGALDVVFKGISLNGKPVRFDLIAAPANPLHVRSRRHAVETADMIIGIARDAADFENIGELRDWIVAAKRDTPVSLIVDRAAALIADPLAAAFAYEQFHIDFETNSAPIVSALKQAAKTALLQIRNAIDAYASA